MKKIGLCLFFMAAFLTSAGAMETEVSLFANNNTVDARVGYLVSSEYGIVETGLEACYRSDEFMVLSTDLSLKSDEFLPGSRYRLGFKFVYEDAEEDSDEEGQLGAMAFLLGGGHDLSDELNPLNIPVSFNGEVAIAPQPLTWMDGESYMDAKASMSFHIMANASIIVEYRYLWSDFDEDGKNWDKSDHNLLLGYKFRF